jgi:4-hydroxy-3-polyprenylbenzoate decarboxylase
MAYRSMREFLGKLEAAGELVRVTEPVSTVLEMTEIQRRLLATAAGRAVRERRSAPTARRSPCPASSTCSAP